MWLGHKRCTPLKGYRPKMTRLLSDTFLWVLRPQILPTAGCGVPHFMLAASPSLDVWKMSWKSSAVICLWKLLGWHQKWTASFGLEYDAATSWWSDEAKDCERKMTRMMRNDERSRYLMLFPKSLQHAEHCSLLQRIIYFGQVIESGVTGPTCLQCAKHFHCLHEKSYHLSVFLGHALKLSSPMYPMIHTGS